MVAKKHQNPSGGLNAAGRAYFKRKEGSNLKAPVKSGDNPRRASFLARMAGVKRSAERNAKGRTHPSWLLSFKSVGRVFPS